MKWLVMGGALVFVAVFLLIGWLRADRSPLQPINTFVPAQTPGDTFRIRSRVFDVNDSIPVQYTCDGQNARPPLSIQSVPEGTKSLAIVMYDPDAPGGTFVHWLAWNIPQETKEILEGILPATITEGTTSFRSVGYQGPCPPSGTHRYIWRLYALRTILSLDSKTTREDLEAAINTYVITQTELMGRYTR